jgi:hypothetical protein
MKKMFGWLMAASLAMTVGACGDDTGDGGDGGDDDDDSGSGNSGNSSSSSNFSCCLNGAFYECPSSDAVAECPDTGGGSCSRDSSRDDEC